MKRLDQFNQRMWRDLSPPGGSVHTHLRTPSSLLQMAVQFSCLWWCPQPTSPISTAKSAMLSVLPVSLLSVGLPEAMSAASGPPDMVVSRSPAALAGEDFGRLRPLRVQTGWPISGSRSAASSSVVCSPMRRLTQLATSRRQFVGQPDARNAAAGHVR